MLFEAKPRHSKTMPLLNLSRRLKPHCGITERKNTSGLQSKFDSEA